MNSDDCNNMRDESKENENENNIDKKMKEEIGNHNIQLFFVLMDENEKIYTRYTIPEFMKLVDMRIVSRYPTNKSTEDNTKKEEKKDSSLISILKLIIWITITILCTIISFELFQLIRYTV